MRVNEKMRKALSILLCLCMLLQNAPVMAFAATTDNLCDHHTEHTTECGYAEAVAGSDCTHVHSESCYALLSCVHEQEEHECTVESGCITMELDCHHTHGDCGYAEAVAPQECTTCQSVLTHAENCGYVAPVAEVTCDCVPGEDGTLVHTEGCGYVAPVAEVKCACQPTVTHGGEGCTYVEGKAGSPCTHTHAVKVDSADSCYKLLCSHADGGHDDACGYAAAVEAHECHYECAECANSDVIANQSADWCGNPLCSQEDAFHVTSCAQYVAPENPQCFCVEKCTEANVWCDICGFDYSKCTGTGTAAAYADGDDLAISGANMSSSTPYLASGSTTASATQPETGGYAYWDAASNTITLNNFTSATDAATGILYDGRAETLCIELVGNNSVTGGNVPVVGPRSGVSVHTLGTNVIFSGDGTLTATGTGNSSGYGVFARGDITVDSGTTLIATAGSSGRGVFAEGSIIVNGGSLTGNGGESGGNGVYADTGITVNGGSLTGNSKVSHGVYTPSGSISVSGDSHIVANGGSSGNKIPVGNLPEDYYYYASGDGTDKTFAYSADAPLTGTVTETYFELVTAQHLSDTYTSNGDATHSRYCSCALHTKVIASEACSGGSATCTDKAVCGVCRGSYGELAPTNHASTEFTYAANEDGTTHKKMHKCCSAVAVAAENHTGGTATCKDKAVCTVCGTSYGEVDKTNHVSENYTYTDNGDGTHTKTHECGVTVGEPENHTLTYTTNGSTITESCSANCGYSASLTLKAPANLVFDYTDKEATVEGEIIAGYKITYSANAVIMAGDYTATLTVGDYSVSLAFTIAKADPDVDTPTGLTATYGQTLADVELPGGWAWKNSSASVGSVGSNTFAAIYSPANISNFNTLERDVTVVVAKAMPTVTAPVAADDLVYNGTAQTLVTAGTANGGTMQYRLSQNESFSSAISTGKNAGTYTVYYKVVGDANHNDSAEGSVTVTIAKGVATADEIPVQKHFHDYATVNTLALSQYLPADRGETTYTLGAITGNFFADGTAVTETGSLTYTTRAMDAAATGSIAVNVVMENYGDVTLTVPVELVAVTAQTENRIVKNGLTEVPAGLANTGFNTLEKLKAEQQRVLAQRLGQEPQSSIAHYDVKLQFSPDGGKTWVDATEENFPADGLTVTLPYPSGTGKDSHKFVVSHMFTTGNKAGTTETPAVTKTADGIQFTVTGLSPVSVAWSAIPFDVSIATVTNGTVCVSPTQTTAGTQVTITVTPKSGYKLSTLTVKDAAGNAYAISADNNGKYYFTMPAANVTVTATFSQISTATADPTNPKTGDDFHILCWSGMMLASLSGLAALVLGKKKFYQR